MEAFKQKQTGWLVLVIFISINVFLGYMLLIKEGTIEAIIAYLIIFCFFIFILLLFYNLNITVTLNSIYLKYGIGLIRKTINLSNVKNVRIVRNPWYYGLGIKIIPNGMLYNIHGLNAIELSFANSKRIIRIGSSNCTELKLEIEKRLKRTVESDEI